MLSAPGVVLVDPKFPHNVGTTIRACSCFGVESLIWTGSRVEVSKYKRLPREERMKGYKSVRFMIINAHLNCFEMSHRCALRFTRTANP